MNKYQAYVDISRTWKSDEIDIVPIVIKAHSANKAMDLIHNKIEAGEYDEKIQGREYYVWEITEEDIIEQE